MIYLGEIFEGKKIKKKGKGCKIDRIVIKKTPKYMHCEGITTLEDGTNILIDEDIVKEAIVSHYLTVDNKVSGGYICQLLGFFESNKNYYLITEYGGDCNLKEFVEKAHKFIKQKT